MLRRSCRRRAPYARRSNACGRGAQMVPTMRQMLVSAARHRGGRFSSAVYLYGASRAAACEADASSGSLRQYYGRRGAARHRHPLKADHVGARPERLLSCGGRGRMRDPGWSTRKARGAQGSGEIVLPPLRDEGIRSGNRGLPALEAHPANRPVRDQGLRPDAVPRMIVTAAKRYQAESNGHRHRRSPGGRVGLPDEVWAGGDRFRGAHEAKRGSGGLMPSPGPARVQGPNVRLVRRSR